MATAWKIYKRTKKHGLGKSQLGKFGLGNPIAWKPPQKMNGWVKVIKTIQVIIFYLFSSYQVHANLTPSVGFDKGTEGQVDWFNIWEGNWDKADSLLGPLVTGSTGTYILNASTQPGKTQLYVDSATVSGNLRVTTTTILTSLIIPSGSSFVPGLSISGSLTTGIFSVSENTLSMGTAGVERLRIMDGGEIRFSSGGVATTPIISFINDSDTGIFTPGSNMIAFATAGSERIRVFDGGEIRIQGSGVVTTPILTLAGDTNTGLYSPENDAIAMVSNATREFIMRSGGIEVTSFTASGNAQFNGNVTLGNAAADDVAVNSDSFTFVNVTTVSFPSGSRIITPEAFICNQWHILSDPVLLLSSAPSGGESNVFSTLDSSILNSLAPKAIRVHVFTQFQNNSAGTSGTAFYARRVGNSTAAGDANRKSNSRMDLATTYKYDHAEFTQILDSNFDFQYLCQIVAAARNDHVCQLYLEEVCY